MSKAFILIFITLKIVNFPLIFLISIKNRCKFHLKCLPFLDYTKVNANDQLDIKGSCLVGCYGDGLTYVFNIYMLNNQTNLFEPFKDTLYFYQFGYLTTYLTILSDFFMKNKEQIIYKVEYVVYIASRNLTSSTSMIIYVNFPPSQGTCDITPKFGFAFRTQFFIDCSNFIDKDGFLVSYALYGKLLI